MTGIMIMWYATSLVGCMVCDLSRSYDGENDSTQWLTMQMVARGTTSGISLNLETRLNVNVYCDLLSYESILYLFHFLYVLYLVWVHIVFSLSYIYVHYLVLGKLHYIVFNLKL